MRTTIAPSFGMILQIAKLDLELGHRKNLRLASTLLRGEKFHLVANVCYGVTPISEVFMPSKEPVIAVRLSAELYEKVKAVAERERRSVSNFVALFLEDHLDPDADDTSRDD